MAYVEIEVLTPAECAASLRSNAATYHRISERMRNRAAEHSANGNAERSEAASAIAERLHGKSLAMAEAADMCERIG